MRSASVVATVLLLTACGQQKQPSEFASAPTVIYYESMMRGEAQIDCGDLNLPPNLESSAQKRCRAEAIEKQTDFSHSLQAYLASDSLCNAVRFVIKDVDVKGARPTITSPFWLFQVNYVPDSKVQAWKLIEGASGREVGGKDDDKEIARKVCAIVKGKGATFVGPE